MRNAQRHNEPLRSGPPDGQRVVYNPSVPYLRQNPLSGEWVIIAPERRERPHALYVDSPEADDPAECPFCPGRESETPPEVLRTGGAAWDLRVVPNKYSAVSESPCGADFPVRAPGESVWAKGHHEVVIETPQHSPGAAVYSARRIALILDAYRERCLAHLRDPQTRYIAIFKNSAKLSGASILHPHSQILSLPFVPKRPSDELAGFRAAADCPICRLVTDSSAAVAGNSSFALFVPSAPKAPYQLWIASRSHTSTFLDHDGAGREDLAELMQIAVRALDRRLPGCAFNWSIQDSPVEMGRPDSEFHWYAEIFPRLAVVGGFEWSTSCYINIVPPEKAAAELRPLV